MKAHQIILVVMDHDNYGIDAVCQILTDDQPLDLIVRGTETREVGKGNDLWWRSCELDNMFGPLPRGIKQWSDTSSENDEP